MGSVGFHRRYAYNLDRPQEHQKTSPNMVLKEPVSLFPSILLSQPCQIQETQCDATVDDDQIHSESSIGPLESSNQLSLIIAKWR